MVQPAPHEIRLRGPWTLHCHTTSTEHRQPCPVDVEELREAGFLGRISLTRSFGCPTGLTSTDRIFVVFGPTGSATAVSFNDEPLVTIDRSDAPQQLDVTGRLQSRNQLRLEVDLAEAHGLLGVVSLEIHG